MRTFKCLASLAFAVLFGGCGGAPTGNAGEDSMVDGGNVIDSGSTTVDRPAPPTDSGQSDTGLPVDTSVDVPTDTRVEPVDPNGDLPTEMMGVPFEPAKAAILCDTAVRWHVRDDGDTVGLSIGCTWPDADGTVRIYAPQNFTGSRYGNGRCAGNICGQRLRSDPANGCRWGEFNQGFNQFPIQCNGQTMRIIERLN